MDSNKAKEARRREILGIPITREYQLGSMYVENITAAMGRALIDEGFMDPEETPPYGDITNEKFVQFLEACPAGSTYVAFGDMRAPSKYDQEVTLYGVVCKGYPSREDILRFVNAFRLADQFEVEDDGMFCEFD